MISGQVAAIIANYWGDITTGVLAVVILATLYKRGKKDLVKSIVLDLVKKAEDTYGKGAGATKYAAVITALYDRLPLLVRLVFTKDDINNYIDAALHYAEKQLTAKTDDAK